NITVLFDGDSAGIKAALRGIDMILKGRLNVRVLLFPDNEDPDSYSRKVGTTEFQKFLKENAQDFVSFKAGLYAKESNDPIKRAESIKEIVTSIAQIPDPVKRSVYIQETSALLKIQESVLLSELNKVVIQEKRKTEKEKFRQAEETQIPVEPIVEVSPTKVDTQTMVERQEQETIRLLLNYTDQTVNDQLLTDFVLSELEDVEFFNPVYRQIYEIFKKGISEGNVPDSHYFIHHGSEEIKNAVTGLITPRYDTSKHWSDKYHIYFPKEKELINQLAFSNILRLKFRMVQKMMEDNLQKVKLAESGGSWDDLDAALTIQTDLKEAEQELAKLLGIVIAR
ncbi:MAG TPA: DNA primase, partial [Cyclobacteriaceae bacterium]|nr:DNA primase [Cyclobacteriaceae bacterium]